MTGCLLLVVWFAFQPMPKCGRCEKTVYPTEQLKCLDKVLRVFVFLCVCVCMCTCVFVFERLLEPLLLPHDLSSPSHTQTQTQTQTHSLFQLCNVSSGTSLASTVRCATSSSPWPPTVALTRNPTARRKMSGPLAACMHLLSHTRTHTHAHTHTRTHTHTHTHTRTHTHSLPLLSLSPLLTSTLTLQTLPRGQGHPGCRHPRDAAPEEADRAPERCAVPQAVQRGQGPLRWLCL